MSDTRFKKGQVPWNKGLKGVNGTSESRFKKGHIPHSARPVGYERINKDGHVEVKVEGQRQMVYKHRWTWEQHNGKIPSDCVVTFKDGDRTNCNIENLELMTRAELVILNRKYGKKVTPQNRESYILLARLINARYV